MDSMTTLLTNLIEIPAGILPALNNLIASFLQSGATSVGSLPFFLNPVEDIRQLLEQGA
jgi:hypothetical protein